MPYDFLASRPRHGYCYLDFLDVWLHQAIAAGDVARAGRYAREIGHYAMAMHPELGPRLPPNIVLGEN